MTIARHKTAIRRYKLSKPVNLLLENALLDKEECFFDYGCGHGQDIEILTKSGYNANGYDPHYRPDIKPETSDVVNLGFVLNVIESPAERDKTLAAAFGITGKVLCVAVMTILQKGYDGEDFSDGVLSARGTFQKYFEQEEIKEYLESNLGKDAVALEPGIFLIFKEEQQKLQFLETRKYRKRLATGLHTMERPSPVLRPSFLDIVKDAPELPVVVDFIMDHGRVPAIEESEAWASLIANYGSKNKMQKVIGTMIDTDALQPVIDQRKEDLRIFYALRRFDKRGYPKAGDLPLSTSRDIREFFGSYKAFLDKTNELLFSVGRENIVTKAFGKVKLGKHLPDAVYIHPCLVDKMPPEIQVIIGLASSLLGEIEECNLLKVNKVKRKVSFMVYEDFDKVPHPALRYCFVVDFRDRSIKRWNFEERENPPILHRKETFVDEEYAGYNKFAKLTKQEEKADLLSSNSIGTKKAWEALLKENGLVIKGHQLKKAT